jgi:hypothetical protein
MNRMQNYRDSRSLGRIANREIGLPGNQFFRYVRKRAKLR